MQFDVHMLMIRHCIIGLNPYFEFCSAINNIKLCLNKITSWMSEHFLKLNMDKSQLLVCGKQKLINDYKSSIECLNNELQIASSVVSCAKILSVHFRFRFFYVPY